MNKGFKYFLRAGLFFIASLFLLVACQQQGKKKVRYETKSDIVKQETLSNKLYFSGVISPLKQSAISAPSSGTIKGMKFSYGQKIEVGQPVILLQSAQMQKDYDAALTNYLKAKDALTVAENKFVGTLDLWNAGLIARNAFESEQSALSTARISLYQAQQSLELLLKQTNFEKALNPIQKLKISDTKKVEKALSRKLNQITLTAKHAGIALKPPSSAGNGDKKLQVGSRVKESEVLVLVGDLSGISLAINISEVDIDKVYPGMKAKIESVAYPNLKLDGMVSEVSEQASTSGSMSSGLPTFAAKVIVPNLSDEAKKVIRVGMSVKVELMTKPKEVLMIDREAVFQKDGESYVNVISDGKKNITPITISQVDGKKVVISQGLKVGQRLEWQRRVIN